MTTRPVPAPSVQFCPVCGAAELERLQDSQYRCRGCGWEGVMFSPRRRHRTI